MYHTIIIVGNVGRDAEMRYTPSGAAVASFSVATNRQYTASSGEKIKETVWFRVSAWGKQAEVCNQYVKKGMKVLVEGRLTADPATGGPRVWTGKMARHALPSKSLLAPCASCHHATSMSQPAADRWMPVICCHPRTIFRSRLKRIEAIRFPIAFLIAKEERYDHSSKKAFRP